ncbi:hypothetical protein PX52LOC_05903 [Limnoglobus roseus]|uniref:Uncharacterized protein n=1 Tax=Limnoglobus roseus TaxID=2598579 RepID=A0A5C1AI52_9BACT|nr:hypothetical protein PX52LOC_05903 [Limnoglobus roseus]
MFRGQTVADSLYVLDFVQQPNGRRYLSLRLSNSPPVEQTAFSSAAYRGSDLSQWRSTDRLCEEVRIADGRRFEMDAHGLWLLPEEVEFLMGERAVGSPWVNGIPPLFAPK